MDVDVRIRSCKTRLPFKCKHCTRRFSRMNELQIHNKLHKKPVPKPPSAKEDLFDENREPIPKLVIRRNSSPIKGNNPIINSEDQYEIVDLTSDDNAMDSGTHVGSTENEKPRVICSPSQKDSGIDDCSPQSYQDCHDPMTKTKNTADPVYSPCLKVQQSPDQSASLKRKHSSDIQSPIAHTSNSNVVQTVSPDSTTNEKVQQCYTVNVNEISTQNNGFITIDLDRLHQIVGVKSLTDKDGNISVTLDTGAANSRNIFDVINTTNEESASNPKTEYVPSPKKPRRSYDSDHEFDTGDSQFNFVDSNQVELSSDPLSASYEAGESDEDTLVDDPDVSRNSEHEEVHISDEEFSCDSDMGYAAHDPKDLPLDTGQRAVDQVDSGTTQGIKTGKNSNDQLYNFYMKSNSPNDMSNSRESSTLSAECSEKAISEKKEKRPQTDLNSSSHSVICVDIESDACIHGNTVNCIDPTSGQVFKMPTITPKVTESSASKYQSEFAKFVQKNHLNSKPTIQESKPDLPITCDPNANIFESFDYAFSGKNKKMVKVTIEDWDSDCEVEEIKLPAEHSPIIVAEPRVDEVQETPVLPCAVSPKGPLQSRRSINTYCTRVERLSKLRKRVVVLLHLLFPRLEYPRYFSSRSLNVDCLLEEITALLKIGTAHKNVTCMQSIPLENVCCDLKVLLCGQSPFHCLNNFRKKICRFLEQVLPNLKLPSSFQRTGENVDDLLNQVIEFNSS